MNEIAFSVYGSLVLEDTKMKELQVQLEQQRYWQILRDLKLKEEEDRLRQAQRSWPLHRRERPSLKKRTPAGNVTAFVWKTQRKRRLRSMEGCHQ
eukprot:3723916-Amphidinium_carterae.1